MIWLAKLGAHFGGHQAFERREAGPEVLTRPLPSYTESCLATELAV